MVISSFRGDYWFLSNFSPSNGRTLEHEFQAAKTFNAGWVLRILSAGTAAEAKRLGRQAPLRPDWEQVKDQVMLGLLRAKFAPGSALATKLLATGDVQLVEGNSWGDTYWGVFGGVGQNKLGLLLMQVRNELRQGGA